MALSIYNSLSRKIEPFVPLDASEKKVGIYVCGPTVYSYVTVGNWRTYGLSDLVVRALSYDGYDVQYYMNITDVGHLTGDNEGDADAGEDRMEKAKAREGKTAWDIAKFYTSDFKQGYAELNLTMPTAFLPATDHIQEQLALIEALEEQGLTYAIDDGIYFDTVAYEKKGFTYGELSNLDQIKAGARVEFNKEKRNPRDFAVWKFSPTGEKRDMEWPSKYGVGFPGWHIECSAMSMKYLGNQFDIHIGGEDLKSTHHPNEIAQAQGATGISPFVKYWIHGAFLQVDGGRMGKSLGNAYTLHDIEKDGFNPLALRYFYFSGHYRSPLNFTWEALGSARNALKHLYNDFLLLGQDTGAVAQSYKELFTERLHDDLDMPGTLAVVWKLLKDEEVSPADKRATLIDFDRVLGLGFATLMQEIIPEEINELALKREEARENKDWNRSDELREEILAKGYVVKDTPTGPQIEKI
jgi:cysteinyl-tRNA synthetase